jgi:transcriptional regulator GlxA family with amidase domain
VARRPGPVRTGDGFLGLIAESGLADLPGAEVLIVPGGNRAGLTDCLQDADLLRWLREVDAHSRWTCSVCTGSLVLAAAGLLSGRRASTHWRARDALGPWGVTYSPDRVTVDGKYMTSAGVAAGIDMGLALCGELAGRTVGEAIELSMQYDPAPPFGTGDARRCATPERVRIVEEGLRRG